MESRRDDHHRISPTAKMVAYARAFSDIPYAKETSRALACEDLVRDICSENDLDLVTRLSAPLIEARYKCFNRFICAYGNVLELAVGMSIERGISVSADPNRVYIGTDLPDAIAELKTLFRKITSDQRPNHHLEIANVLSYEELSAAADHLGMRRGVAIINEGLWMYLTTDEQTVCAENIRAILEHYGGEWITPDICDLESDEQFTSVLSLEVKSALSRTMQRISNLTGRPVERNYFPNRYAAIRFFGGLGFEVKQYPAIEKLGCLSTITKLWGPREMRLYAPGLRQQRVWVMSLRRK